MKREKQYKGYILMKKLLFFVIISIVPSYINATINAIQLYNNSAKAIEINGFRLDTDQTFDLDPAEKSCTIKTEKRTYFVKFPSHNSRKINIREHEIAMLDFNTIQWIAGDLTKAFPQGLDSISITNDTYYPIAIAYVLNTIRSRSRTIDPQETVSKQVGTEDNQRTGFLEIIDNNRKKHTFNFPRRIYKKSSPLHDWYETSLSAQTIGWFDNGFTVSIR